MLQILESPFDPSIVSRLVPLGVPGADFRHVQVLDVWKKMRSKSWHLIAFHDMWCISKSFVAEVLPENLPQLLILKIRDLPTSLQA